MKDANGDITPLGRLIAVVITVIVAGIVVAMLFGDNEQVLNKIEEYKNKNNTVQTETNRS